MRKIGSRYWAHSYVILKSKVKIYLEDFFDELKAKMNSDSKEITVKISKQAYQRAESMIIKKDDIEIYAKIS